jgi:type IV secretory pathway VirB2 component (pilin)
VGSSKKSFVKQLERMPKLDELAIVALGLNAYVVFTNATISSYRQLLEPMASTEVTIIQASILVAALYAIEYMGDEEDGGRDALTSGSSSESEGLVSWIADMAEGSTVVDILTIGVVFMGYQFISGEVGYGTSLTQISANPEVIAMQLSVVIMLNFGIFTLSDLMGKS